MCICLVHIAASGTRNRVLRHSSYDGLSEEGGVRTRTASELEYRRWRPLDMFRNKPMFRVKGGRRFVAVDPTTSNVSLLEENAFSVFPPLSECRRIRGVCGRITWVGKFSSVGEGSVGIIVSRPECRLRITLCIVIDTIFSIWSNYLNTRGKRQ